MPELPEVETVRRTLAPQLAGRTITDLEVFHPDVVEGMEPEEFRRRLVGATFGPRVGRRGKYLILHLSRTRAAPGGGGAPAAEDGAAAAGDGAARRADRWRLVVHLRMTGRLTCVPAGSEVPRHTHLRAWLDDGMELRFCDARRFGRLTLLGGPRPGEPRGLRELGPEPLGPRFDAAALARRLGRRRGHLKSLLLNQRFVAGIGNIYADEILFRAGLHPLRRACELGPRDVERLHGALRGVLREAIGKRGTTIRDYVDGRGRSGEFAASLRVYGRAGEPCRVCGAVVGRIVVGGRSSYFCPGCQPAPREDPAEGGEGQDGERHGGQEQGGGW